MVKKCTVLLLLLTIKLYGSDNQSKKSDKLYNSCEKLLIIKSAEQKEAFVYLNQDKTSLLLYGMASLNENLKNNGSLKIINKENILHLSIKKSTIQSLEVIGELFPFIISLTLQNNVIEQLKLPTTLSSKNDFTFTVESNKIYGNVEGALTELKKILHTNLVQGNNEILQFN